MSNKLPLPIIGITMGDPVGVGPEIVIKTFEDATLSALCRPLVVGDVSRLAWIAHRMGSRLRLNPIPAPAKGVYEAGVLNVLQVSPLLPDRIDWGHPTYETGRAMVSYIETAVDLAVQGEIAAMVTCPINKKAMAEAGFDFPGHTELLAKRTGTEQVVMMLAGTRLRVVLVTIHTALCRVAAELSTQRILETIILTAHALRERFGMVDPRLAVAGLNPHAGEGGLFGDEEARLILPAVLAARAAGVNASGPFAPDTVFYHAAAGQFDGVVCMYHDQGLIPFKLLHFEDGVNTTLGLPIIRTSVDHGTAYDIAGTGRANERSLRAAVEMAVQQVFFKAAAKL
ncbi:MAG: 4-hydroxythreonine-4-phosphate dehydrogenase PdxA [Desulfobacterales bacterium]|jgi:4-hydroxythreonine-4-phosphate dehydrogenase|nr:4-hydroxythreonine-4-phosphate dehydrogenase PdxA [Desulfobacterales bacterium]